MLDINCEAVKMHGHQLVGKTKMGRASRKKHTLFSIRKNVGKPLRQLQTADTAPDYLKINKNKPIRFGSVGRACSM